MEITISNQFYRKKALLILTLCIIAFAAVFFIFFPDFVFAEEPPGTPKPNEGGGIAQFAAKSISLPVIMATAGVLYVIQSALVHILWMVAGFLNNAFWWNVMLFPSNMLVVLKGWTILRDIANGFFILIILWIAFTIIFSIEQFGGKKLLVRVIAVALLINFSLTLVTLVFGVANILATSIAEKMPKFTDKDGNKVSDIGGYIVHELRLHTIFRAPTPKEIQDYKIQKDAEQAKAKETTDNAEAEGFIKSRMFASAVKSSLGSPVREAQAIEGKYLLAGICGIGLVVGAVGTVVTSGAIGLAFPFLANACGWSAGFYVLYRAFEGVVNFGFDYMLNFAITIFISIIFLTLTILAIFRGALALLIRIVMEIILAVTAPAAFLFAVIPGKKTAEYWNMWLSYLFRWAFFAPIFYFILYLALLMIQHPARTPGTQAGVAAPIAGFDIDSLLQVTLPLILIWVGANFAQKTGGAIAQTVIDYGKKAATRTLSAGAAVASGGASLAVGRGIAALSASGVTGTERITGALSKISQTPYIGRATGPALRRATEYIAGRRERVDQYYGRMKSRTAEDTALDFRTRAPTISPEARVADMRHIADMKRLDLLSEEEIRETITLSKQFGLEKEFAKLRPDLAITAKPDVVVTGTAEEKEQAQREIHTTIEKLKMEDVSRIDLKTLGGYREREPLDLARATNEERETHRHQIEKETLTRETVLKEILVTGDSEKLTEILKAITRLSPSLREGYRSVMNEVLQTMKNWNTIKTQNPIVHAQLMQDLASNAGQRLIAGFELPQEIKQEIEKIREERRGEKKKPQGGFGGA